MASREWAEEWLVEHGWEYAIPVGTLATLLDRFAADAVREEREACAKLCDGIAAKELLEAKALDCKSDPEGLGIFSHLGGNTTAFRCSDAIRARTEAEAE